MSDSSSSNRSGIGFFGLLTIVFIIMKLAGIGVVANWTWWWVLSPLWIGWCLIIVLVLLGIIITTRSKK